MRVDRTIEPGRYALHPDGGWHLFTDRAELDFKPVAVMRVKERPPVASDPMPEPAPVAVSEPTKRMEATLGAPFKLGISRAPGSAASPPAPAAFVTVARPEGGHVGFVTNAESADAIAAVAASVRTKVPAKRAIGKSPAARPLAAARALPSPPRMAEATRTATPGDVFRAIADEFGILPAVGASVSTARFKPLVTRDDDADAARAYERAIEERQGRE